MVSVFTEVIYQVYEEALSVLLGKKERIRGKYCRDRSFTI